MKKFAWGVVGTGAIAQNFCADIASTQTMQIKAVCSRDMEKAKRFGALYSISTTYDDFSLLLQDADIDAVYIATPNNTHISYTLQAIAAGKPVLTEKPMGLRVSDIDQIIAANAQTSSFAMEGMWSRFLPAITALKQHIHAGTIGEVQLVEADLSYLKPFDHDSRFFNPDLGGGAGFDLGVYPLSLTLYLLGLPEQTRGQWFAAQTGCDMRSQFTLIYPRAEAKLGCGFDRDGKNRFLIMGNKGAIEIDAPFLKAKRLVIYSAKGQKYWLNCWLNKSHFFRKILNRLNLPGRRVEFYDFAGHGLQFQAEAVMQAVRSQQNQSQVMPLEDTQAVAAIIQSVLSKPAVKAG
ncbi:putative dehydrogenase [Paenochrobactrum gallinarii]|uniref:Putative dehydrogenase n=1 Tax=Paenochrobactrum gallinarii TaxID=643673 RepID=A0A841LXM6_9HYPH|nr:Gfo/Idh/MocA family oxidoreductase [Paenochrobactrum gallinarii]MBB6260399.1 putative dehydrogenase [Paenochrobactrum gallinarii]